MSESKRTSIPKEEKISKLDNTIKYHEDMIKKLKVKKNNIVNPSCKFRSMSTTCTEI